jgi:aminoglycoside phosphotransferase (APT) family kinase protein
MPPNRMPAAEVEVTADLVRRLLADQHPDLLRLPVEFLANGWDNAMFRLGTELAVRMPRRKLGAAIIAHEQRWLPQLAPRLPLPVPYPERTGHSALGYPYSWSVVPFLRGAPATDSPSLNLASDDLASDDLAAAAVAVGGFLGALHVPAPEDAPANPVRGVPLAERATAFEANLAVVSGESGLSADGAVSQDAVRPVWESALAAPVYDGPPVWLHGDLHPANILVDDGRVSGVIDFGDITSGDPATDLAVAWMLLPLSLHGAFRAAYEDAGGARDGAEGDALWRRARGWALHFALVYLAYSADNPQLLDVGRRTLGRIA